MSYCSPWDKKDTKLPEGRHLYGERCKCGHHRDWHGDRHLPLPCCAFKCGCMGWAKAKTHIVPPSFRDDEE